MSDPRYMYQHSPTQPPPPLSNGYDYHQYPPYDARQPGPVRTSQSPSQPPHQHRPQHPPPFAPQYGPPPNAAYYGMTPPQPAPPPQWNDQWAPYNSQGFQQPPPPAPPHVQDDGFASSPGRPDQHPHQHVPPPPPPASATSSSELRNYATPPETPGNGTINPRRTLNERPAPQTHTQTQPPATSSSSKSKRRVKEPPPPTPQVPPPAVNGTISGGIGLDYMKLLEPYRIIIDANEMFANAVREGRPLPKDIMERMLVSAAHGVQLLEGATLPHHQTPPQKPAEEAPKEGEEEGRRQKNPKGDDANGGEGQTCLGCSATSTPEWRRGPMGPRTLCNACGLVYAKLVKKRTRQANGGRSSGRGRRGADDDGNLPSTPDEEEDYDSQGH